jgi:hypothetical protein
MTPRPVGGIRSILTGASVLACTLMLAGCGGDDMPTANQSGPVKIQNSPIRSGDSSALPGTPMAERVAVVGLLNKRNGLTRDLQMKPGEALRVGDAIVRLQACETTAPWENVQETGAFVQLDIRSSAPFPAGCSANGPTAMWCSIRSMTSGSKAARWRGRRRGLIR